MFCFVSWVGVSTVLSQAAHQVQDPSPFLMGGIANLLVWESQKGKAGCTDGLGNTSEPVLKSLRNPRELNTDSHQTEKEVMCLILLVPVKFPDLTLAPEVTPPRDPFESKQNPRTASVQFVLPNHVIALELTAIIYVPLCAVLNLDRPAAYLHGCQQKSAHSQEITNLQVSLSNLTAFWVRGAGGMWFLCSHLAGSQAWCEQGSLPKNTEFQSAAQGRALPTPHSWRIFKSLIKKAFLSSLRSSPSLN